MNDSDTRSLIAFLATMNQSLAHAQKQVDAYTVQAAGAVTGLDRDHFYQMKAIYDAQVILMTRTIADFLELFPEASPECCKVEED